MSAQDDLQAALTAEDGVIDQAVAYIKSFPATLQAAVDLQKSNDQAGLVALQADVKAHADAITAVLPTATPATPPVDVPPVTPVAGA